MSTTRLEAFSDAVIAILITVMVLELHVPEDDTLEALRPLVPVLLSYVLSFAYLGIYWNNHHHLMQVAERISGSTLWANLHLLFWLSLVPFVTSWMGERGFAQTPVAAYGAVLLGAALAFFILEWRLLGAHPSSSTLAVALGRERKELLSVFGYALGIGTAFIDPRLSLVVYVLVSMTWLIPDRRIERALEDAPEVA